MSKGENYYIGLDCGTSSVGWAVTDEDYNILRAKGKRLWGSRLFDEARTAADRRTYRSSRRRNHRAKARLKLLEELFAPEIIDIDPDFYIRLRESFFYEEDKEGLVNNSKNTLFNDANYSDKDFHKQYPTIWHLRKAIIEADKTTSFDIRLYFLAVHHIMKHRGHFLYEGELKSGNVNFSEIYDNLIEVASKFDIEIADTMVDRVEEVIKSKSTKTDKKKQLKDLGIFIESEREEEEKDLKKRQDELIALLVGSTVTPQKIFSTDVDKEAKKISFGDSNFDDKQTEIEDELGDPDKMELIFAAKRIYDFGILSNLLKTHSTISAAMVANYEQHQKELRKLKELLKPYPEDYVQFFKTTKIIKNSEPCYSMYVGKAYEEDKNGRRKSIACDQEAINKQIEKLLTEHGVRDELLDRAKERTLLPKQRGQAKGTIPQQLHHNELGKILAKLAEDFPSFAKENPNEPEKYNNKVKKILSIHNFRIPYYCGPIVSKKKSEFSWADEEISELVRPWNFEDLVHLDDRADNFIKRMTNQCTYLIGEDVLPKCSIIYQKYMVLNELNNLKINGVRIVDIKAKQRIFNQAFVGGELRGNVTLKTLKRWMIDNSIISENDDLAGTSEIKILPKYSTHLDFVKLLGESYLEKYGLEKIESVIDAATVLGDEKKMLARKIAKILECDNAVALKIARKLSYKDWGNFSKRLLTQITADINGANMSILDAMYETNSNFMELLGGNFGFKDAIDEYNHPLMNTSTNITYKDVKNLYCSPAVKRTVWQAIKIVDELVKVKGAAPAKIFLEVTRGDDSGKKGKYTLSRHKQLQELYKQIKTSEDYTELLKELNSKEPRDLQSKKLYLYFTQMGRCAYSGERIDLEELQTDLYDIDHIYPRSKTKDDSILKNLVLVKSKLNREKTNVYPISADIRERMRGTWSFWLRSGLITKDKYLRLTRNTPLTADELSGFISRQIVETGQSIKAIRDLLRRKFQNSDTKVILVKAGQVSDFRKHFGYDQIEKETGRVIRKGHPEFVKVRAINDLHHAKDAYLNIVVGNVMSETFTDNPYKWLKKNEAREWSMNPHVLWCEDQNKYQFVQGWHGIETIETVSRFMKRNDILWTRMNYIESGALSDQQIVGKAEKSDGIISIKKMSGIGKYDPRKYGGYRSPSGAYFSLIECYDKKNNLQRRIIPIPQVYAKAPQKYINNQYGNSRILVPVIKYKSLIKINGFPMHISRKGSDVAIGFYHAVQAMFPPAINLYIKKIVSIAQKNTSMNGSYAINEQKDGISPEENAILFKAFLDKLEVFRKMPELGGKIDQIKEHEADFYRLEEKEQVIILNNFINIFNCGPTTADLSNFVPKAGTVGKGKFNDNVMQYETAMLVNQSVTGLYEKVIDLKTFEPKD